MPKKVLISIYDSHDDGTDKYNSELTTVGTLSGAADDYSLVYTETNEAMVGCVTTLRVINGKKVVLTRTGGYDTEMVIERNCRHNCYYETPFGEFMMGIYANDVRSDYGENGGKVEMQYTIDFNTGLASVNKLRIEFQEAQSNGINNQ